DPPHLFGAQTYFARDRIHVLILLTEHLCDPSIEVNCHRNLRSMQTYTCTCPHPNNRIFFQGDGQLWPPVRPLRYRPCRDREVLRYKDVENDDARCGYP